MQSFTHFKKNFYAKVEDFSLFNCGDINLLKVVLDGLKVNYIEKGKIRCWLFYPKFFFFAIIKYRLRKINKHLLKDSIDELRANADKKILISDVGRIYSSNNNKIKSSYFENIIKSLQKKNVVHILDTVEHDSIDRDSDLLRLKPILYNPAIYSCYQALLKDVSNTFKKIKRSRIFNKTELKNIKIAFQLFLEEFILWSEILKNLPSVEKCYFVCHYHKEGQIYALKKRGIICIELQHGLIAPQDIFYVFPETVKPFKNKILVADKIFVFGSYWKDVLLKGAEYDKEQIEIIGYFMYSDSHKEEVNDLKTTLKEKKVILVTSQTFLHTHFISFVKSLCEQDILKQKNAVILLKPHPSEKVTLYLEPFMDSDQVVITEKPLPVLFQITDIHISIYSTSIYDALRYGAKNYVFKVPGCEDYVDEILSAGIATEIKNTTMITENMLKKANDELDSSKYYESFQEKLLLEQRM